MGNTKSKKGAATEASTPADRMMMDNMQWKLWNVMDMRSEKEMNELASFLGSLRTSVSVPKKASSSLNRKYKEKAAKEGQYIMMIALNEGNISLDNLQFEDLYDGIHMPDDALDEDWVIDLMNSYRFDDKLLEKYAARILLHAIEAFKVLPNVDVVDIPDGVTLTVVGDTHGQLHDLFHIFDVNGLPSPTNWYLFNGDLVDRGTQAVEIILVLLAWKMVYPEAIRINRGNHEEYTICTVYGFRMEVIEKYSSDMFDLFLEFFGYLPLATIIQKKIMVLHGGLFCTDGIKMSDINTLPRDQYTGGVNEMSIEEMQTGYLRFDELNPDERDVRIKMQLIRDVLWSDPQAESGRIESDRSAGCKFGPDVCRAFLKQNGLALIIRSHEAVPEGYHWPYGSGKMLLTVFSATNYGGAKSAGAFVSFGNTLAPRITTYSAHRDMKSRVTSKTVPSRGSLGDTTVEGTGVGDIKVEVARRASIAPSSDYTVADTNHKSLVQIIISVRQELATAFEAVDTSKSGKVSIPKWSEVMETITGLGVAWQTLQPFLSDADTAGLVDYKAFLDRYQLKIDDKALKKLGSSRKDVVSVKRRATGAPEALAAASPPVLPPSPVDKPKVNLDKLYGNREQLLCIFRFFDVDCSGTISKEEFENGVKLLKKKRPDFDLPSADNMWKLLDMDGNNEIDVNEFMEVFRVVDTFTATCPPIS